MKKKYLNIALIITLIIIWGSVIKKCVSPKKLEGDITSFVIPLKDYDYKSSTAKDTFILKLNKRDPFGASKRNISFKNNAGQSSEKANVLKVKQNLRKNATWPSISYHGFVKSNRNKTKLVILKISNQLFKKREKESIKNVKIIRAYNDSLLVSFNGINKTIKKNE